MYVYENASCSDTCPRPTELDILLHCGEIISTSLICALQVLQLPLTSVRKLRNKIIQKHTSTGVKYTVYLVFFITFFLTTLLGICLHKWHDFTIVNKKFGMMALISISILFIKQQSFLTSWGQCSHITGCRWSEGVSGGDYPDDTELIEGVRNQISYIQSGFWYWLQILEERL